MRESNWVSRISGALAAELGRHPEFAGVLRGSSVVLGFQVLHAGISFAALVGLARMIGPEQYGIFVFYFSLITLLSLFGGIGLPPATVRFVAAYREGGDWPHIRGYLRVASLWAALASGALALVAGVVTVLTGLNYGGAPPAAYWLAFAAVPLLTLVRLQAQTARAFLWPVLFEGPARILVPFVLLTGVFAMWLAGLIPDARHALGAVLAGALIACLTLFVILRRRLMPGLSGASPVYETRLWLATAGPMLASSGAGFILAEIDILIAGAFLPPREVAIYQAAARISMLSAMIIYAQNSFVGPRIAALYHSGKQAQIRALLRRTVRLTLALTVLFALFLILFGPWVLGLFGPEFRAGYTALLILLASVLTTTSTGPLGLVLNMTGHVRAAAIIMGGAVVLNAALHVLLVPRFGIVGSASAVLLANIVIRLFLLSAVKTRTGLVLNIFSREGGQSGGG